MKASSYFPGLRFTGNRGIAEAMEIPKENWCKDLPFFFRFGWGGIESPEFRAAIVAAVPHRFHAGHRSTSGVSPESMFMATAPPRPTADDDIGLALVVLGLGDANGGIEVVIGMPLPFPPPHRWLAVLAATTARG